MNNINLNTVAGLARHFCGLRNGARPSKIDTAEAKLRLDPHAAFNHIANRLSAIPADLISPKTLNSLTKPFAIHFSPKEIAPLLKPAVEPEILRARLWNIWIGKAQVEALEYHLEKVSPELKAELETSMSAHFNSYQIKSIKHTKDWGWKLLFLFNADNKNLETLKTAGFNGYQISQLMLLSDWKDKLDYLFENNNQHLNDLKDAGFNGSQISQLMLYSDWKDKSIWICNKDNRQSLVSQGLSHYQISQILRKKAWETEMI